MRALAAIFIRALREHTRSRMLAIGRGIFAAMVIWIFVLQAWASPVAPGLQFLHGILFLNVLFILLAATSYFASSITEEKEEGTIALLVIAGVSPTGLLLAKSTTRILEGILLLAVQLPFALLAVALGGVMWDQVIASYIALGGFLVLSGNLALLASVVATRTAAAGFGSAAMLAAVLFGDDLLHVLGMDTFAAHWHSLDPFARLGFDQVDEASRIGFRQDHPKHAQFGHPRYGRCRIGQRQQVLQFPPDPLARQALKHGREFGTGTFRFTISGL